MINTDDCWLFAGGKTKLGYGLVWENGKGQPIYRVVYENMVGKIPDKMVIDHLCRVPPCINPEHLEPVTQRVNTLRGTSKIAQQAKQTHCKRGHEFNAKNTLVHWGKRKCRVCDNLRHKGLI